MSNVDLKDIQFSHLVEDKRTLAFVPPLTSDLNYIVNEISEGRDANIVLYVGLAKTHPEDNYEKKIGREVSTSKIVAVDGILNKCFISRKEVGYCLIMNIEDEWFSMLFSAKHGVEHAKLQWCHLCEDITDAKSF